MPTPEPCPTLRAPRRRTTLPLAVALLLIPVASLTACGGGEETAAVPAITPTPATSVADAATPAAAEPGDDATPTPGPRKQADDAKPTPEPDVAGQSIAENTDPSAPKDTVDSAPGVGDAKVPIVMPGEPPATIEVRRGDLVAFRAVVGSDDTVQIQGHPTSYAVSAGTPRIIRFEAETPGRYAITLKDMDMLVGTLVVSG